MRAHRGATAVNFGKRAKFLARPQCWLKPFAQHAGVGALPRVRALWLGWFACAPKARAGLAACIDRGLAFVDPITLALKIPKNCARVDVKVTRSFRSIAAITFEGLKHVAHLKRFPGFS